MNASINDRKLLKFVVRLDIAQMIKDNKNSHLINQAKRETIKIVFANSVKEFLTLKHSGQTGQQIIDNKVTTCTMRYNDFVENTSKVRAYKLQKLNSKAINSYYNR